MNKSSNILTMYKYEDNYFKGILKNLEPMFHCLQPDSLSLFLPFGIFLTFLPHIQKCLLLIEKCSANLNAAILGKKLFDHCQKHSRKENIAEDNQESFVSMFLRGKDRSDSKSKKYFTNYEKERCALDLFFAGSETTSSTLRWLLLYMIEFPEVQEKCFQEIKKVVGDIDETISLGHKSKLPYVSATIMEVMRSAVIVTKLTPREAKENTTLQGHFVKRGSLVLVDISSVMTDKKYWKEPKIFKPERFLDEEGNIRKSRRCIFFSTDKKRPRSCPGEIFASELTFVSFANLIANFKFIKEDDNDLNDLGIIFRVSNSCRDYRLRAVLRHN
ncbi:hypothetical protein KUTeg_009527 [Tegillarca granosa]|uniref:Cytochrome P450 n=1 Tax=Tegillarca granosa TaxID=220873 RepID=A0ABQ9F450_TEGGR|nr:hypothetical protein KUTeg_009527 [Tegillarca granosa]